MDWNTPTLTQAWADFLAALKGRDESNAKQDYSTDSNIPTGTIRFSANRWDKWSGSAWAALSSKYLINVDQVDGYHAGNASGQVALSNGTVCTNLNADKLDGQHAGNASGQVALSNGTVCTNLNADKLDGQHGSYYSDIAARLGYTPADSVSFTSHANNTSNPHAVTKSQVGLGSVQNYGKASQAEAEAMSSDVKYMTPLRTKNAINQFIPAGTKMVFYQAAAPTGWTQDATVNDKVLRVVSTAGGGTGGSWTLSGISVNSHTLTTGEMPLHGHTASTNTAGDHTHTVPTYRPLDAYDYGISGQIQGDGGSIFDANASTGGGGGHTHPVTVNAAGSGGGHIHGVTLGSSWRPAYVNVIVASKD